jgi:DinB superfamily
MPLDQDLKRLQFPIGPFVAPVEIEPAHIDGWIDTIAAFPAQVREAVRPMDNVWLEKPYRPGGWNTRQVVHHCADSHMHAFIRIKFALTLDQPTIMPYPEAVWAELPDYELPIAVSLDLLEALHIRWSELLRRIGPQDLTRTYYHPESKRTYTIAMAIGMYAWHCRHHLAHIRSVER